MDEMWGRVNSKTTSSWLWHAINHDNGDVVAYVIGSTSRYVMATN